MFNQFKYSLLCLLILLLWFSLTVLYSSDYTVPGFPFEITSGDIDADGDYDLLVASTLGINIVLNNGEGTFSTANTIVWGHYRIIELCQLDNQSGLDLLVLKVSNSAPIQIEGYFNGDFAQPVIYPFRTDVYCNGNFDAKCGDFNNDGLNDVVIMGITESISNNQLWCYMYNLGSHYQFAAPVWVEAIAEFRKLAIADYNEDNRDDIVFIGSASHLFYSTGNNFTYSQLDVTNYNSYVVTEDFDNDGDKDIITSTWDGGYTNHFRFYENQPGTAFTLHEQIIQGWFDPLYSAELNGDNYPDLMAMTPGSAFAVLINAHDWTVQIEPDSLPFYNEPWHECSFNKFDNNQSVDLAILRCSIENNNLCIMFNDGTGDFQENPVTANEDNVMTPTSFDVTCYPNPFKDKTTLSYLLPEKQPVQLAIYNLKGQKVFSLQDAPHQKGLNTVTWNGTDDSGRQVSSGIYFSKLITSGKVITSKMVMLK